MLLLRLVLVTFSHPARHNVIQIFTFIPCLIAFHHNDTWLSLSALARAGTLTYASILTRPNHETCCQTNKGFLFSVRERRSKALELLKVLVSLTTKPPKQDMNHTKEA